MSTAIYVVLGVALGAVIGWLLRSAKPPPPNTRLEEELRQQRTNLEAELNRVRGELIDAAAKNAAAKAEINALNERLASERQQIESLQDKFRTEFEAISNKLLVENSSRFDQQSRDSLEKLLAPLKEKVADLRTKLDTTQKETATYSALLRDQISRIGAEADNLSKALRGDVKALGNWGENMLDQILEKSGLQRGIHYRRQQSAKSEEGDQRFMDVIVELPEGKTLIIDSKVSLRNYEDAVAAADDASRAGCLSRHVEDLRRHIRSLSDKRYQDIHGMNTPDFVLMYVPIEGAFTSAIAHDTKLWGDALERDVILITNSTLLATLRTVAHVWRLADQQENAREIADRGGKLYDKFVGFLEDLQQIRKALGASQDSLDSAMKKLQTGPGNLVRQAELMKDLGAKASKSIPPDLLDSADALEVKPLEIKS
jgi:DNA recombination protein RmuC